MVNTPVRLMRVRLSSGCCATAGMAELRSRAPSRTASIEGRSRGMAVSLLGQAVHEVHVHDQGTGGGHGPEVLLEDRRHLARSVHARETAIDGEAEGGVTPPEDEAVRLVGEVLVDEGELLRALGGAPHPDEEGAIGGVGVDGLVVEGGHALRVVLHLHHGGLHAVLGDGYGQRFLGGRPRHYSYLLAVEGGDAADTRGVGDEEAAAVDEGHEAEVYLLLA